MQKTITLMTACLVVCTFFLNCTPRTQHIKLSSLLDYPPKKNYEEVDYYFDECPRPYEIIGMVAASPPAPPYNNIPKLQDYVVALRKEAAKIGADAIMKIEVLQQDMGKGSSSYLWMDAYGNLCGQSWSGRRMSESFVAGAIVYTE